MTIINPNSIAGITSVTAEAGVMNFYKSDGTLAGLQLNGVNFNTTSGVSTFNNLYVGGVLTYEDVKNVDSVGIITARGGVFIPDSTKLQLGNAAGSADLQIYHNGSTSFIDDAGTGDLCIRANSGAVYIQNTSGTNQAKFNAGGSSELHHNGTKKFETTTRGIKLQSGLTSGNGMSNMLQLDNDGNSNDDGSYITFSRAGYLRSKIGAIKNETANNETDIVFETTLAGSIAEKLRIKSNGLVGIGTNNPTEDLHIGSNSPYILLDDYDNSRKWRIKGTGWFAIEDVTAGADRFRIDSNGNFTFYPVAAAWNKIQRGTATHYVGIAIQESDATQRMQFGVAGGTNQIVSGAAQHDVVLKAYDANLILATDSTERLRITSAGLVSIPNTGSLQVGGAGSGETDTKIYVANTGGNAYIQLKGADSSGTVGLKFGRNSVANRAGIDWSASTDALVFRTGGTGERLRISSAGKVLIGSGTLRNVGGSGSNGQVQIEGTSTNTSSLAIINNQNNVNAPYFNFGKTRGTSTGAVTTVADGDNLGMIRWSGADGTDLENSTANIKAIVNGTVAGNQIPTDLIFETSATNSSGRTERLRITSSGISKFQNFGGGQIWLGGDSAHTAKVTITDNAGTGNGNFILAGPSGDHLKITSAGGVHIGNTFSAHAAADNLVVGSTSGSNGMTILTGVATGSIFFNHGSGNEGVIQYVHTGTEHMRIKSEGYIKLDAGGNNHGGGVYSREKACTTSGTNVCRFTLTHGALAGTLYAIGSNNGNSVSKVYAFAGHFGSNDLQKIADSGAYSGNNFSVSCSTSNHVHTFSVTTTGENVEISLTFHMGAPNQNLTYEEL